ncbi:MAG: D-tyrosyl-tRNA(Tyr) deacylase [Candidatus Wallbacteria bacterium]|nr:D-tyrosyl-tRNA(Tyr) deacylase [Candidatus Wallbacteria bacterium]
MIAVLQRVSRASVSVDGRQVAAIGRGLLALAGIGSGDGRPDIDWMARKVPELRLFEDEAGKMNLSLRELGGELLLVSQFTLLADCRRGRRPSFSDAAAPEAAAPLFEELASAFRGAGVAVRTGVFRATMQVELVNDGPVTILLDSRVEEKVSRRGNPKLPDR